MKRLKGYLGLIPLVLGCAAIALVLYSLVQPPSALGPIHSDHIFDRDGGHGHKLKPDLRNARGMLPARPHPLPFQPNKPEYADRITKRAVYYLNTNSVGFRGVEEYEEFPAPGVIRIGTIGDSITFGYGVADDESYPAVLEQLLSEHGSYEVINAGVHGYDSRKGLHALRSRLLPYHPHIVTLCVGVNDSVSIPEHAHLEGGQLWLPEERYVEMVSQFEANMDQMLGLIEESGAQPVLMVPSVNSFFPFPDVQRVLDAIRRMADERGLPLVDLQKAFREREEQDGLVLLEEDHVQTLVRYRNGKPKELVTVEVDPDRFQYVADEVYDYIDAKPVDMALAYDGSHPNAAGMRVIAEQLEEAILAMDVKVGGTAPPAE